MGVFEVNESEFKCIRQYITLRKRKKMTRMDVADITGLSHSSIASYESGERSPSLKNLIKIVHAVGGDDIELTGWG